MKPLWYPTAWSAEFTADGKTTALKSAFPITESPPAPRATASRRRWCGSGSARRPISRAATSKGKTVMIYSIATPGGRDHSADWSGAIRRANDAGAAAILVEMGFPGNAQSEPEGAVGTRRRPSPSRPTTPT